MPMVRSWRNRIVKGCYILLMFLLSLCIKGYSQSYGLQFFSHEVMMEKRTSLDLSSNHLYCFSKELELSFDVSFESNSNVYFGYIFRLINEKGQNIDLLYNQKEKSFQLVAGEAFTDISFSIDDALLKHQWIPFHFSIDASGIVTYYSGNRVWKTRSLNLKSTCFKIIFGANNEHDFLTRDLPPMKLRNIGITIDGKARNFWPLNESAGTEANDTINQQTATVVNPSWIKPRHSVWENRKSFTVAGNPSIAFDDKKELLYIIGNDSLYRMVMGNGTFAATALSVSHGHLLGGNQSLVDPFTQNLYNFYPDLKLVYGYDTAFNRWSGNFNINNLTEFWQANKFITKDGQLFILGGYGQLNYKNLIQRYNLITKAWDTVKPAGDFYAPRYLAALGTTTSGDTAYILGGYGSNEGNQLLRPNYFYDLFLYDVRQNRFKKIYTIPELQQQFVLANSLIIDTAHQNYYALIFPNDRFNSQLQLITGSLTTPHFTLLGAPLPYSFNDVKSFADLFYCKTANKLVAVTLYSARENSTEVNVYTIDFPVNLFSPTEGSKSARSPYFKKNLIFLVVALVLLVSVLLFSRYRKNKKLSVRKQSTTEPAIAVQTTGITEITTSQENEPLVSTTIQQEVIHDSDKMPAFGFTTAAEDFLVTDEHRVAKSKISLFGSFEAITGEGVNLTRHFTPLLKELFLLILIDSLRYNKGVSAEKMNDILWHNKDIKDAKNNRSVNLVKLKNILEKLGHCTINRQANTWKFEFNPQEVEIDFARYLQLANKGFNDSPLNVQELLSIIQAGPFLQEVDYEWLHDSKAEISNYVIEALLNYVQSASLSGDPEKQITIANVICSFDELNEHALNIKCKSLVLLGRHALAKTAFDQFAAKYKHIYGEDFKEKYSKLVGL